MKQNSTIDISFAQLRNGLLLSMPVLLVFVFLLLMKWEPWMPLLGFAAASLAVYAVFRPVYSFYICTFVLFSGIVWGLGLGRGFLPLAIFSILALATNKMLRFDTSFLLDRQFIYVLGFLAFVVLSVYSAVDQRYAFEYLFVYFKLLVFYLFVSNVVTEKKEVWGALGVAIAATFISILYGFQHLARGLAGAGISVEARMAGLTDDPNILALHVVFLTPVVLLLAFHTREKWKLLGYLGILLAFTAGLAATFSRGGTVAFVLVTAYVLYRRRSWKLFLLLAAALGLIIVFFIPKDFWSHLGTLWDLSKFIRDRSLRERSHLLEGALQVFGQHPFMGIGIGNFLLISQRFVLRHLSVHNVFLQVASETGTGGLIFFSLILISTFTNLHTARMAFLRQNDVATAILCEGLLIGFGGVTVAALFLSVQEYFVLWTMFGLSVAIKHIAIGSQVPAASTETSGRGG